MQREITIFRVRKSFFDLPSQKGAFFTLGAAIKIAKKYKLNVYANQGELIYKHLNSKRRMKK